MRNASSESTTPCIEQYLDLLTFLYVKFSNNNKFLSGTFYNFTNIFIHYFNTILKCKI
jgi:hypothetical protein